MSRTAGFPLSSSKLTTICQQPYGRIRDLIPPTPAPTGSLRSSTITFHRLHAATVARNVIHGLTLESFNDSSTTTQTQTQTRIRAQYQHPLQVHAVRDWISSHPRITLPVIVFLLGTLTYTVKSMGSRSGIRKANILVDFRPYKSVND